MWAKHEGSRSCSFADLISALSGSTASIDGCSLFSSTPNILTVNADVADFQPRATRCPEQAQQDLAIRSPRRCGRAKPAETIGRGLWPSSVWQPTQTSSVFRQEGRLVSRLSISLQHTHLHVARYL